jgi:hypothetical protein
MKKILGLVTIIVTVVSGVSFAANFDEFFNNISGVVADVAQKNIDNLTKDLGVMMGGVSYHEGKSLGFPGFDVGIHVPVKQVNSDNTILKEAGVDTVFLPMLQAEIGLPMKFDLLGRYSAYEDSTLVGAGLRYGIIRGTPALPLSLSVQAVYNTLDVSAGINKFKANNMTASVVASAKLPVVDPYLGISYGQTTLEPDASIPLPKSGLKGEAAGAIIEAGVNFSLFPLTYVQLGATVANGEFGYTAGLGVKY